MNSQNQYEDSLSGNNLELDDLDEELDELDDELSEVESLSSKSSKLSNKLEETVYGETLQEPLNISDLKTISINLEESHPDSLDYKKLSLPKLRNIVSEKGLASDASKLKKNELLKLLGAE
jgi:predicted nuclease with TOPRIM domain